MNRRPEFASFSPPRRNPDSQQNLSNVLMGLVLVSTLTACSLLLWEKRPPSTAAQADRESSPRGELLSEEKATIDLFRRSSPAVVHIKTRIREGFFGAVREGAGTGFVWDAEGHIVTNAHVIGRSGAALVIFSDDTTAEARLVGLAPARDLAVLKIDDVDAQLRPLPLGTSADLQVGQKVFAIGNPFGLDQSLTTGIISALGREILSPDGMTRIWDVIQTDAAINPGNSGGPLLDSAGRVIGLNTAIYSPSGASAGIGFAIPVDSMIRVVPDLIRHRKVIRAGFGFEPDPRSRGKGVVVRYVFPGSAADRAGFRPLHLDANGRVQGDIVVAVDGKSTPNRLALNQIMDSYKVGDVVTVTLRDLRRGKEREVRVPLQEL